MPTSRIYTLAILPASEDNGFIQILMDIGRRCPRKQIEATSLDTVLAEAKSMATEYGNGCLVSISVLGRKPSGFDQRTKRLFFNLEKNEPETKEPCIECPAEITGIPIGTDAHPSLFA